MPDNQHVPAAQYLRMSTEHQQYSFQNQAAAIQKYAAANDFEVVRTYSDAAKSGLVLRRRAGLRQLLQDVVSGTHPFRAILVYDISRWGRFQDTDESAHYEFLCKSAGVPVHYCAESFANDGTLPSLIMKALKRTMAGEYSRELGVKVREGQRRLAQLGFKQGGRPGYGLRRMLLSSGGAPKQQLEFGERKSITTDRVILVPGPAPEVAVVRGIYDMLISEKRTVYAIARELNRRRVAYTGQSKWDYQAVYSILTNPKYAGTYAYGRTSSRLYTPKLNLSKSDWIVKRDAFEPIISLETFEEAQKILKNRTFNKSDEDFLNELRLLLAAKGKLTHSLINGWEGMPSPSAYIHRFGSLRKAYERIGYDNPLQFGPTDLRRRTQALRRKLMNDLVVSFPELVRIERKSGRFRGRLRLRNGRVVPVLVARSARVWKNTIRWVIDPIRNERRFPTLLARLDEDNSAFKDFHLLPSIDRRKRFYISAADPWLARGRWFRKLSELYDALEQI